ncbi:MAG: gas vesicle protein K [Longimicrobiales bacterium]|nr:gas vesicle protein K [Longimicrobiales bacterium]
MDSTDMGEFARVMTAHGEHHPGNRVNLGGERGENGLVGLVLTVVKLLHELVEKQAIRRIDAGNLTDEEVERLGFTLMRQAEEIARVAREFGLEDDDLNLDLGPLGKLL